ncbi:hypothetical protein [Symbiopectobacterium sp.]|uniref:hypothetical protein n=1 Tax=Symbiopectobacterium sp. TaxID=2952789 RepID=UPI003F2CA883
MSIFTTLRTSPETTLNEWLAALDSHIARVSQAAQSHKNPSPLRADGFDITTQEPVVGFVE